MRRIALEGWREEGSTLVLEGAAAHRIRQVLRLGRGDTFLATDGSGREMELRIGDSAPGRVVCTVLGNRPAGGESPLRVTLVQGIPRLTRMDLVIQKATELGVARIVPFWPLRGTVRPDPDGGTGRLGRWRRIATESAAQCRRAVVPEIEQPVTLEEFLRRSAAPVRILLDPVEESPTLDTLAVGLPRQVEVIVGPEGGLAPEEADRCRRAAFLPIRLGPRVLRTETAGFALLALLQYRWGDLGSAGVVPAAGEEG